MKNKTIVLTGNHPKRNWHLIDLAGLTLGRIVTQMTPLLIGKHKVTYSPHRDDGDYVIAINASQIKVTGKKMTQKIYYRHSGWTGNLKELTLKQLFARDPRLVILNAVSGMLPQNRLKKKRLTRIKVFPTSSHPYDEKLTTKHAK